MVIDLTMRSSSSVPFDTTCTPQMQHLTNNQHSTRPNATGLSWQVICVIMPQPVSDSPSSRVHKAGASVNPSIAPIPVLRSTAAVRAGSSSSKILYAPFKGRIFSITDGTRWRVLEPLSEVKLQQDFSPCEGRQVYTCVCLDKPWSSYAEAVVKIKFQSVSPIGKWEHS
jgi:hypothetical protein